MNETAEEKAERNLACNMVHTANDILDRKWNGMYLDLYATCIAQYRYRLVLCNADCAIGMWMVKDIDNLDEILCVIVGMEACI